VFVCWCAAVYGVIKNNNNKVIHKIKLKIESGPFTLELIS